MLISKRKISKRAFKTIIKKLGDNIIGFDYADKGHPHNGIAYYQYLVYKYKGQLLIVKCKPHENDGVDFTIGVHK